MTTQADIVKTRSLIIVVLLFMTTLFACKSWQNEGGPDWATVEFSIDGSRQNQASYAVSGDSTKTALICAVSASSKAATYKQYIMDDYDRQLENLINNTASLRVPLNTSLRLVKVTFTNSYSLNQIATSQPTAHYVGISDPFIITGVENEKTIYIKMSSLGTWGSSRWGRDYWGNQDS